MSDPTVQIRKLQKLKAEQAARLRSRRISVVVPGSYVEFVRWLGVTLTEGQTEFARICYDGTQPSGGLARRLFGFEGSVPMGARRVISAVCGARAGKSYIAVALRLVHGMLVRNLSSLASGQRAVALIVAPNDRLRGEVLNYALGAVKAKPEIAQMLVQEGAGSFMLRRDDGHTVAFETGVATQGGYGARGRSLTDFALDECAFFRDASFRINDQEIFRAGAARVLPGGQIIVASTPWAQGGLLYELHRDNFGHPRTALVAHAPTLVFHDSEMTRSIVDIETKRDPDNAKREYGAEFMATGTTVFFEGSSVDAAISDEEFSLRPDDAVVSGGDFGFRSDSSALVMVALRNGTLHVFDGLEVRPDEGLPLKPSATVELFAGCIAGRCSYVMADAHYREAITELLTKFNLVYAPAPLTPADTYVRARMLLRDGRVRIHPLPFRDRLLQQMREVQGKPTSGGGMSIVHPRWSKGGHGDICAALVLGLWQLSGDAVPHPAPLAGTREWEQDYAERRRKRFNEQREKPDWMPKVAGDRGPGAWWRK